MEEKKKGKGLICLVIILILMVLGLGGYILYDKGIILKEKEEPKVEKKEVKKETKEELDIDSRLVQHLYSMVSQDFENNIGNALFNWEFNINNTNAASDSDEYTYNGKNGLVSLVARNLSDEYTINIDEKEMPKVKGKDRMRFENMHYFYSKGYIENIYKQIFGDDAKLDTSKEIPMDGITCYYLVYDQETDNYYPEGIECGSPATCGQGVKKAKLLKAIKTANEIKLYQNIDYTSGGCIDNKEETNNYNYIYTFKLDNDGMYKFVSRKKEEK